MFLLDDEPVGGVDGGAADDTAAPADEPATEGGAETENADQV